MMIEIVPEVNRAFSAGAVGFHESWGVAPAGWDERASLALNKYDAHLSGAPRLRVGAGVAGGRKSKICDLTATGYGNEW